LGGEKVMIKKIKAYGAIILGAILLFGSVTQGLWTLLTVGDIAYIVGAVLAMFFLIMLGYGFIKSGYDRIIEFKKQEQEDIEDLTELSSDLRGQ
jgi:uncharacterized membrane protein